MHLKVFSGADEGAVTADFDHYCEGHALVDKKIFRQNVDVQYRLGEELTPQVQPFTQIAPGGPTFVIVASFST
jgi:hypothetical protein